MIRMLAAALAMALAATAALAQGGAPSWISPDLLAAAKAEGALNVYSSVNEQEGLPLWQEFEKASGVKVNYTRANDAALTSKIQIEARSGQQGWDALVTTSVTRLPPVLRAQFDVPQAAAIPAQMRDPDRRWYGVYANYNAPSYNTNLVKLDKPPRDFEEFLTNNLKMTGAPTDYWGQTPAAILLGQLALNPKAPHPNAARLAANFLLSKEGQTAVSRFGRLPLRKDVTPTPPDALSKMGDAKIVTLDFSPEEEKFWQKRYQDYLRGQ